MLGNSAPTTVIELSPLLAFAGLGSVTIGLLHALWRARSEGGGLRTVVSGLHNARYQTAALMVIDFTGGVLVGVGVIVVGLSNSVVLQIFDVNVALGWFAVGLIGPAVAGRLFTGGFVRGRYDEWIPEPDGEPVQRTAEDLADAAWRLRVELIQTIEDQVWILVRRHLEVRADELRKPLLKRIRKSDRDALMLVTHTQSYFARPRRTMPDEVEQALAKALANVPPQGSEVIPIKGSLYQNRVEALGEALLSCACWDVVLSFISPKDYARVTH